MAFIGLVRNDGIELKTKYCAFVMGTFLWHAVIELQVIYDRLQEMLSVPLVCATEHQQLQS